MMKSFSMITPYSVTRCPLTYMRITPCVGGFNPPQTDHHENKAPILSLVPILTPSPLYLFKVFCFSALSATVRPSTSMPFLRRTLSM